MSKGRRQMSQIDSRLAHPFIQPPGQVVASAVWDAHTSAHPEREENVAEQRIVSETAQQADAMGLIDVECGGLPLEKVDDGSM